jgi:hypothetical protein
MGPDVQGDLGGRSNPKRGDRREPVRAAGRGSAGELKDRSMVRGSDVHEPAMESGRPRRSASSGASRVDGKAREEAGKTKRPATRHSAERAPASNFW